MIRMIPFVDGDLMTSLVVLVLTAHLNLPAGLKI